MAVAAVAALSVGFEEVGVVLLWSFRLCIQIGGVGVLVLVIFVEFVVRIQSN